jgi:endonuclease-3
MPAETNSPPVATLLRTLRAAYPSPRYELNWEDPLQLLVAAILASQCTDERVNQVTPALFGRYRDARAYADADPDELESYVKTTGFYRDKAKAIQEACRALVEHFDGAVPATMDELLTLPRVARKTANVVLTNAFGVPSGVVVDGHVARVSRRLGLTVKKTPEGIEKELMRLVPKEDWIFFGNALVLHGRYVCTHWSPRCEECVLHDLCPRRGV